MRRWIPLSLRRLAYTNGKGSVNLLVRHERFLSSLGVLPARKFTEFDASEFKEERPFDGSLVLHDRGPPLNSCGPSVSLQVLENVDHGCSLPDHPPYNRLLKECAELGKLKEGRILHALILKSKCRDDIGIHNSIINMYAKCGSLGEARKFFDEMPLKDMVSWSIVIIAYSQNGRPEEALLMFPQMLHFGLKPNEFTFSGLVKASGALPSSKYGMQIHAVCIKYGSDSNVYVGTSLVDMYSRAGHMEEAQTVFDGLVEKNAVSWNALIGGHARKDEWEKALDFFQRMKRGNFEPDQFTYSSMLSGFSSTGALEQGKWIHAHVIKSGEKLTDFVGHTLLHMYAKSGSIEDAEKVFARLRKWDVVSWNSMLTGYAHHGLGKKTLEQFEIMRQSGVQPNIVTFLCVLTACSHAGLLEQGMYYLDMMKTFKLEPEIEHYVTMVDLLSRAGEFNQALEFIRDIPIEPVAEIWKALLGACRMHKNVELGAYAAERVFELDPFDSGPYVILSNIYASAGRKNDVARVRKMMKESQVRKEPACSWVEIGNSVHMFIADSNAHPLSKEIYQMWENVSAKIKEIGYVPDTNQVLLFVKEHEKEATLQHHSEKLALAFALLKTSPGSTIRIKKNIRICDDCHLAFKFASKVIDREIIVRDTNRFHHFRAGSCSCGGYW